MIALLLAAAAAAAAPDADEVLRMAREAQQADRLVERVRMVLVGRSGRERVREFEMRVRRDDGVVRSAVRFLAPADVAGTALVLVDHPDRPDEHLLYLPALGRVNRISGRARTGSFLGSDFAYEDLELAGTGDAAALLRAEDAGTWTVEVHPDGPSSYSRMLVVVSKEDHLARRVEYFDRSGQPLKVLEVLGTARDGEAALPVRSVMRHLQRGTETRLEVLEHRTDVPDDELPLEMFTAAWLERG